MPNAGEQPTLTVSVIVPTYNRAAYLQEALGSIFQQTLPPAEIIIVDDGSTDNTEEIVQHARKPVQFYRQEHKGVAAARNLGMQMATGDLIAWLDSDDLWEPEFVETTMSSLAAHPEWGGVYSGITMINEKGEVLSQSVRVVPPEQFYDRLAEDCFLATPTVVARKSCYDRSGGFDLQFSVSEDYDMWLRLGKHCAFACIPTPLARIRVHASNTMSSPDALCKARLALIAKHFGKLASDIHDMSESSRRAYGHAYRFIGTKYIESGVLELGWEYLRQATRSYPPILARLDTFYELACGDQPRGVRGQAHMLDIERNGAAMLRGLDAFFAIADVPVRALRGTAYGNAYLALAMLSDQAGDWGAARRYLLQAIQHNPKLLSESVLRRLVKLCLGSSTVHWIKSIGASGDIPHPGVTNK
jgi:glycosyltransferase involved in cell wall biosynthesis